MLNRITTPLFYVNSKPHIGHLYSSLYADAICVWLRAKGQRAELLTGTDEHGVKVFQSAILQNQTPQAHCDRISSAFKSINQHYHLHPDIFIRTTDRLHKESIQTYWKKLLLKSSIYQGTYQGWYCQNDENFIQDKDLHNGLSSSGYPVDWVEEVNYFLDIKPVMSGVKKHIEMKGGRHTKELLIELETFRDICISRPKSRVSWGIDVPDDPQHVIYVWFDALLGYLHQLKETEAIFHHVIGKDIVRFHQMHLPFLHQSIGLQHDINYVVHHHWIVNGRKMSKSLQNIVCPIKLLKKFNYNSIRLHSLTTGPQNYDISFDESEVANVHNDYIGSFHNSVYRILGKKVFTETKFNITLSRSPQTDAFDDQINKVIKHLDRNDLVGGYIEIRKCFFLLNKCIDSDKPWNIDDSEVKRQVLGKLILMIRNIMFVLQPYVPQEIKLTAGFVGAPIETIPYDTSIMVEVHNDSLQQFVRAKY